jgi:hypothetical protein
VYPSIIPASDVEVPALDSGAHPDSWTPRGLTDVPKTSLVSSTSLTDSISLTGTDLDTGLSSTLQDLATAYPVLDSHLGSWISSDELADYLGLGALGKPIPATCLVVQASENPEAWVSIPDGETTSQTVADLESSSWVLLDDLVCELTENAFVSVQSILVYQPDESSNAAVYVCLTNPESTLPLDHTLNSFHYTDITGVSSDLGLGNGLGTALLPSENTSSDPHLNAPTHVGSKNDPLTSNDDLAVDSNLAVDSTSDPLTSTPLDLDTANSSLDSSVSFDVDVASNPSDLDGLGVSECS